VEKEEKRERLRRDVLQARHEYQAPHEYQENGRHVTGEEVIAWLKTWGEYDEQDAPTCHK
jgi:predicted transcriptional regulator